MSDPITNADGYIVGQEKPQLLVMSELEALEKTREMWQLIASGQAISKIDALHIMRVADDDVPRHFCFCCERVGRLFGDRNDMTCSNPNNCFYDQVIRAEGKKMLSACPLRDLWPNGCEAPDSPYEKFKTTLLKKDRAQDIVDGCDKAIAKLKAKEASCSGS